MTPQTNHDYDLLIYSDYLQDQNRLIEANWIKEDLLQKEINIWEYEWIGGIGVSVGGVSVGGVGVGGGGGIGVSVGGGVGGGGGIGIGIGVGVSVGGVGGVGGVGVGVGIGVNEQTD